MSDPTMSCDLCRRRVPVVATGRGFPPDSARRKLKRLCAANGCTCSPSYRAGVGPA